LFYRSYTAILIEIGQKGEGKRRRKEKRRRRFSVSKPRLEKSFLKNMVFIGENKKIATIIKTIVSPDRTKK